jgi:hypothetical protein
MPRDCRVGDTLAQRLDAVQILFDRTRRNIVVRRPARGRLVLVMLAIALLVPLSAQAGQISLAWDASPDSSVTGYTVYYGTSSGTYTGSVDAGNQTTRTVTGLTDGVRSYFIVKAYNASGVFSAPTNEVNGVVPGASNSAPTLTSPGNRSNDTNDVVSLQLSASDPDNDALTFSATGLPSGLSISTSGRISGTPTTAGTYSVTATVSDGSLTNSKTFTWTVTTVASNGAPSLTSPGKHRLSEVERASSGR